MTVRIRPATRVPVNVSSGFFNCGYPLEGAIDRLQVIFLLVVQYDVTLETVNRSNLAAGTTIEYE